jgi:threonine dehydrogenase-like Zn-dependent dehydrogenase
VDSVLRTIVTMMRALTVIPGKAGSALLEDISRPVAEPEAVLVRTLAVGICGTDTEILNGRYGRAPRGRERLIIGHEAVGIVEAGGGPGCPAVGELVVGIVRRPDPVPCANCAAGEWDMCRNGLYSECGIKELDGFCAEYFAADARFLVSVPRALGDLAVLVEPTSVVAKAWEHIQRIGSRVLWEPRRALITGAGPIGLLAALLGRQLGLEVHVLDRAEDGCKPSLVRALGACYHSEAPSEVMQATVPDVVLECTGSAGVVLDVLQGNARGAVTCLVGVSSSGRTIPVNVGALNRSIVLENDVVFGSVNANRRHYEHASRALARADPRWLAGIITREVPLERWTEALEKERDDVKVVIVPSGRECAAWRHA